MNLGNPVFIDQSKNLEIGPDIAVKVCSIIGVIRSLGFVRRWLRSAMWCDAMLDLYKETKNLAIYVDFAKEHGKNESRNERILEDALYILSRTRS